VAFVGCVESSTVGPGAFFEDDASTDDGGGRPAPDVGTDAAPDARGGGPDVAPDAPTDTSPDATPDASDTGSDAGPDVPIEPDATEDVVEDTGPVCGNGVVEGDEACDDGNDIDTDGCTTDCVVAGGPICATCTTDDECGGPDDRCLELEEGLFCGRDCRVDGCPEGYMCRPVSEGGLIVARQCRPFGRPCETCDDADGDTVCDEDDVCAGGDDTVDSDGDGTPDACDEAPEVCTGGVDEDLDGAIDCADPDCEGDAACASAERCDNGVDDDLDGAIDCDDTDCDTAPACVEPEVCTGGVDEDLDGRIDCADPDCALDPACATDEVCDNGRDDDLDGSTDCADDDCADDAACARPEDCGNGRDDDLDGDVDCDDTDCAASPACVRPEVCDNGVDDDRDGDTDCADLDCRLDPACARPEVCDNGVDDDLDGSTDCADDDCDRDPACARPEDCGNGRDDDLDGRTDCDDPDCAMAPVCARPEDCDNGADDDLDGRTDCDDPDCTFDAACVRATGDACADPFAVSGYGAWSGANGAFEADYAGSCRTAAGRDVVYRWTAPESATVCAHTNGSDYDTVLYVQTSCGDSGTDVGCDDDGGDGVQSEVEFTATSGATYYVVVDGYSAGSTGDYDLTIRRGPCDLPRGETCDDPLSASVGGTYSGSTATSVHDYRGVCSLNTAPDVVYAFTAAADGSVCVDTVGSAYDTTLYVRTTCADEDAEIACNDDAVGLQSRAEIGARSGETYYVHVDGFSTRSGDYTLNVRNGTCDATEGDRCSGVVVRGFGTFTGSTASLANDYAGSCRTAEGNDRVYMFRAPTSGTICADTSGSSFDTVLYVQTSCGDNGTDLDCDDDGGSGLASQVEWTASEGTFYYLVVDGYSAGASGDFVLDIRPGGC